SNASAASARRSPLSGRISRPRIAASLVAETLVSAAIGRTLGLSYDAGYVYPSGNKGVWQRPVSSNGPLLLMGQAQPYHSCTASQTRTLAEIPDSLDFAQAGDSGSPLLRLDHQRLVGLEWTPLFRPDLTEHGSQPALHSFRPLFSPRSRGSRARAI